MKPYQITMVGFSTGSRTFNVRALSYEDAIRQAYQSILASDYVAGSPQPISSLTVTAL